MSVYSQPIVKDIHARCNISSVASIFKYNPKGETNNKFITS